MTSTESSTATAADAVELLPGYRVDADGAWITLPWPSDLAELPPSLAPQIFRWCAGADVGGVPRLIHHLSGDPWKFTLGQKRWLHLWYSVRADGRWLFRSGVKRGAKGTGKDPLAAAQALIEAQGPVVFAGFDDQGRPRGRPHRMALVQLGANSQDQAKDLLRVANAMIGPTLFAEAGVDAGETRTVFGNASRIELLTVSEKSQEGDPATAVLLNETHHATVESGGKALAKVGRRNVAKSPGGLARLCEFTNAHLPGEESVAEDSFEAWQLQAAGKTRRVDILYDSREAAPHLRLHVEEDLEQGIAQAYADSPWTDQERIRDEAQDTRTPPADSVRFYFNALPTNETAWVDARSFDARARALVLEAKEPVAMFLDCSKSEDSTGLVACSLADGAVHTLGCWQRPHGDRGKGWLVPRHEVDAEVRFALGHFDVQWFGVDPSPARDDEDESLYWMTLADEWHRDFREQLLVWATPGAGGHSVLFDMRMSSRGGADRVRQFTEEAMRTAEAIDDGGQLEWDGNPVMRMHVHNARRRPNQYGVSLGKATRSSSKLVDLAVCMVGARLGRRLVLNSGKTRELARSGVVW